MNFLIVDSLSKSFADKVLFKKISFSIEKGDRLALIAKNGAGKSTLLKILEGKETADAGRIQFDKNIDTCFLHQEPNFLPDDSVMEALMRGETKATKAIKNYQHWQEKANHDDSVSTLTQFELALNTMNELDAWDYENQVEQILSNLKITNTEQKINTLSGGQKKRVAIAQILVQSPDFIVMDEPTNHLDMEMIEWLEEYLQSKKITLLIVTHDRYFLDNICTKIIELDNHQIYPYKGNFSYYLERKAEREMMEASELEKAKNVFRRELDWIRKQPKARTVKSKSRVDAFVAVEEKARQKKVVDKINLEVKMSRLGGKILELIKIKKSFGDKIILDQFTYTFKGGEKIGIVGKNGMGKTTLLNIVQGTETFDGGKIQTGETVLFGYYSQKGLEIKEDMRLIEYVKNFGEFIPLANGVTLSASQLLTRFNFPPEQQYSFISKLSGGEKRRLYLMTILITNPNFLILDEPTNDLDIITLQTLEEFLIHFKGCILIVSHDRYFMDRICDSIFSFEGNGIIKNFPGNYSEYREWKDEEEELEKERQRDEQKPAQSKSVSSSPITEEKRSYQIQRKIDELEKEIATLESEKTNLQQDLAKQDLDYERIQQLSEAFALCTKQLEEKTNAWLVLQES